MSKKSRVKVRRNLNADELYQLLRKSFEDIKEHRLGDIKISLPDALMSGFALFSLKDPSLLAFDQREPENLETIYGISSIPCDTQMRTILDGVEPESLRPAFKLIFRELQRGKELEPYQYLSGHYLLSLDGTGYFSSRKIHCENCLTKTLRNGEVCYHHQMLGAALVHPDLSTVVPLMPEPILKQDGESKNDCERNAAKRFFEKFRQDHPHLKTIVIEDALSSNAPHIRELQRHNLRFILGAKESDHSYLFNQVAQARQTGESTLYETTEEGVTRRYHFVNQVSLNASNQDVLVNFMEYWEISDQGEKYFAWVTDFTINCFNCYAIMRGGRARWKIENETYNTLKNQGYHFEHNFGHGNKHLAVVFPLLMMLAFLVDQALQIACPLFQALLTKLRSRRRLWERVRNLFASIAFDSMLDLFRAILYGYRIDNLVILDNTT